jgi:diguanylate cyclase (GGDEF)-like protein
MTPRETILCVDDEEGILTALRQQLGARFGTECEIAVAKSAAEALELVDELERDGERLAVVIADQIMPGMKGVDLLEEVHRRNPQTVKILLTGQAGLDAVVYAINRAGLARYIPKPWDEPDLRLTVEKLLEKFRLELERDVILQELSHKNIELENLNKSLEHRVQERTKELETLAQRLEKLAITDGLTGLYNHRFFHERLALEVERAQRAGHELSLLMVDVDHFKLYNDRNGHPAGDDVLRAVGALLSEGRRANDIVARYGGEEFGVILVDTPKGTAAELAERLRQHVSTYSFVYGDKQPGGKLTISIGVAALPDDAADAGSLLDSADGALYAAKRAGRNRVRVAEGNKVSRPTTVPPTAKKD